MPAPHQLHHLDAGASSDAPASSPSRQRVMRISRRGAGSARPPGQARGGHHQPVRVPLVELAVADPADLDAVGRHLFDRGIYVTLAPYPVVPRKEAGFRCHPRMWGDCTRGMAGRAAP